MQEMIREYGLEVLAASGEEEMARQAHAAYYLALAEKAGPELVGPQQAAWLHRLEREHANLHEALHWSIAQGKVKHDMTVALRLGVALQNFWVVHGPYSEGRNFLEQALAASEGAAAPVRAKALYVAANLAFIQSDFDPAEELCQESLKLFRELGDRPGIAYALYLLAWISRDNIKVDVAMVEEALALFRELGDREYVAWCFYTLAYLDGLRGEYASASAFIEESLARHKELGNKRGMAYSLIWWAHIHFYSQSEQAAMHARLADSLALFKELDDKTGFVSSYSLWGQIALSQGDSAQARSLIEESLMLSREMGTQQGIAEALCLLARVLSVQGDDMHAYALYEEALAIAREMSLKELMASCLEGLAEVVEKQGKFVWAAQFWGAAEVLRDAVSVPIPFVDRARYERLVANIRARLGEKVFAAAWTLGRSLTPEQVLATQGQEMVSPPATTATTPAPTYPAGLTAREVEVLRLVVQGLSNSEIAQELELSEKTIAHHLTHIFNKTTSENRAAAAAFAIRNNLA
jgi:DNA-binding CsgD family transcriptional regulator/tetratricopeptide (TPR) repeat protein